MDLPAEKTLKRILNMKERIIKSKKIKGNLEFDGKIIFTAKSEVVEVKGDINCAALVIKETSLRCKNIDTHGGYINTHGGGIDTDGGCINTHGGGIYTGGGHIDTDGRYIYTGGGYINTDGGYIDTHGGGIDTDGGCINTDELYIPLIFDYSKIGKLTCKLIRFSSNDGFERKWWLEKYHCLGFSKMANIVKRGCTKEIQQNINKLSEKYRKKVLDCASWTKIEKAALKAWFEGGLKEYKF